MTLKVRVRVRAKKYLVIKLLSQNLRTTFDLLYTKYLMLQSL